MKLEEWKRLRETAESWLRTPYHPNARVKGAGIDCCQFLIAVFHESGLIPDLELGNYSTLQHLHQETTEYEDTIREYAREIEEKDVQPGDMVLYKVAHAFAHGAVIIEWPRLVIHAVNGQGVCYSDPSKEHFLKKRERKFFTLK